MRWTESTKSNCRQTVSMTRLLSIGLAWCRKHMIATTKKYIKSSHRTSKTSNVPHLQLMTKRDEKSHTKNLNKLSVRQWCNKKRVTHMYSLFVHCSQTSGQNEVMPKLLELARTVKNKNKNKKKQNEGRGECIMTQSKASRKIWMLGGLIVWKDPRCPIHVELQWFGQFHGKYRIWFPIYG